MSNHQMDHFSPTELESRFELKEPWIDVGPAPCDCDQVPDSEPTA